MILDSLNPSSKRYKAVIAYDGTDFCGFQTQLQDRTVQGVIEAALAKISNNFVRITGAGRTDTGVHATGQVISFNLAWKHTSHQLQKALTANLPEDVCVTSLTAVHQNFHPRFDALSRQYCYTIINQFNRDVLRRRYTTHIRHPLNLDLMQRASQHLIGTYDFAAFGKPPQGDNTVRTITQAEWFSQEKTLKFKITANAFLYRMVRNIVGTLIQVGLGKIKTEEFKEIILSKNKSKAGPTAVARGLCLIKVKY